MAYRDPVPISSRKYTSEELAFVRTQSRFYYDILKDDPRYFLQPACNKCASDKLYEVHSTCTLVCEECGHKNSSIKILAGRICEY